MLIVRGTKKLRDRLRAAPRATDRDESTTMLGDWFANALFWKPQMALFVNARTMLPVFVPLAPVATLLDRAPDAIAAVLRANGMPPDLVDAEAAAMADVRVAPTNDRQVVGVMTEFAFQAEQFSSRTDDEIFALSMRMSDLILGPLMKRRRTPAAELAALLAPDAEVIDLRSRAGHASTDTARSGVAHQLKVTLRGVRPPIWRRVVVDGGESLHHLHDVIQAAFGWYDSHLHEFDIDGEHYGIPHEDDWTPVRDERRVSIGEIAGAGKIRYTYDFGDNWEHDVIVEKSLPAGEAATVPDCIGGSRACPPEDCGGPWGYTELLKILADPDHPEHAERVEWLDWIGRSGLDPDAFNPASFADDLHTQQTIKLGDLLE